MCYTACQQVFHATLLSYYFVIGYNIRAETNGLKDIFIHRSALEVAGINDLNDNQKIEFEVAIDKGKEAATNIKFIIFHP